MQLVLCILALFVAVCSSDTLFPFPWVSDAVLITSTEALQAFLLNPLIQKRNIIAMATHSLATDSYLSLYLGGIIDLFDEDEHAPIFLILELPAKHTAVSLLFELLPPHSLFVTIQHGPHAFGIKAIASVRNETGYGPKVVYHLNHERPWCTNPKDNMDFLYPTLDGLNDAYSQADLVLRNYYHTELLESSLYVPVGASHYRYALGPHANARLPPVTPVSQRAVRCYFKGRFDYDVGTRTVSLEDEEHVQNRQYLWALANTTLIDCELIHHHPLDLRQQTGKEKYDEYVRKMMDVAFAICPLGNNPETFRVYEALEVGAIPLMVRTAYMERDFLNRKHPSLLVRVLVLMVCADPFWVDYPGPILKDWDEIPGYLKMSSQSADELQILLQEWYQRFRHRYQTAVRQEVYGLFDAYREQARQVPERHVERAWRLLPVSYLFDHNGGDFTVDSAVEALEERYARKHPNMSEEAQEMTMEGATGRTSLEQRLADLEDMVKTLLVQSLLQQDRIVELEANTDRCE